MADAKTTALTAATSWASGDLLYLVRDPAGTPASRKITLDNVLSKIVCAANAKAIGVTGYSLTGSDATSMIDLAGTWNTSGNPVALKMAITNTSSGATSKFISLLAGVGGATEVFSVDKDGDVMIGNGAYNAPSLKFKSGNECGFYYQSAQTGYAGDGFGPTFNGTVPFWFGNSTALNSYVLCVSADGALAFGANNQIQNPDVFVGRDAANTLALRNAANAQTFRLYGTYTSGSVFERMFARYSVANTRFEIGTEHTGATARDLEIMVPSTKIVGMDKTTEDNGFINFKATADADATSAISTLATSGAVTHHIQIQINGVTAWIPCSTTDPS